jgi:predicted DNA-binding transcriptional regulator AlpA
VNGQIENGSSIGSLWTAREVATFLKCSTSWVYLHSEDGTLPSVRICGLRRFVPAEVAAWALDAKKGR